MRRPIAVSLLVAMLGALLLTHPAMAGHHFVDNPDGTITDADSGLVWAARDNNGDINWHDAARWAKYTFPSTLPKDASGWRLPTAKELETLKSTSSYYDGYETLCGLNVRIVRMVDLSCGFVWAAEESGIQAWYFSFQKGYAMQDRKTRTHGMRALAVRPMTKQELHAVGK